MKAIELTIASAETGPTGEDGLCDHNWTVTLARNEQRVCVTAEDLGVAFQKAYLSLMHDELEARDE